MMMVAPAVGSFYQTLVIGVGRLSLSQNLARLYQTLVKPSTNVRVRARLLPNFGKRIRAVAGFRAQRLSLTAVVSGGGEGTI